MSCFHPPVLMVWALLLLISGAAAADPALRFDPAIFGFSSEMFYLPEKDAVIVIDANRLDLDDKSQSTETFLSIAKLLFPEDVSW